MPTDGTPAQPAGAAAPSLQRVFPCLEAVIYARDGVVAARLHITPKRLNGRIKRAGMIARLLMAFAEEEPTG